jgi:aconitate hydratase
MNPAAKDDPFRARTSIDIPGGSADYYALAALEDAGLCTLPRLPYSIRILLESVLRNYDGFEVTEEAVRALAGWSPETAGSTEVPFKPARVVLQDFTGVPALVDLAAMRSAMQRLGGDPKRINPLIPVDLVVDHSVQVDRFGSDNALQINVDIEFRRNLERYEFLRWGQKAFDNFRAVPPAVGIVHQVNLEFLAKCVFVNRAGTRPLVYPDTLVGTDSHTTMINGLGVIGWGVGGIEAEAVMLGQPIYMLMPEVVGFEFTGQLPPGATATDLVLRVVEMLRQHGVVGKFVEFYGEGYAAMPLADRATIANMAPEYGATMGYFPVDNQTLEYLRRTGRTDDEVEVVELYMKQQGLFRTTDAPVPEYCDVLRLDLATVEPSLAGPKRPQDRIALTDMQSSFRQSLSKPISERGFALEESELSRTMDIGTNGSAARIGHGAVVIAAITSCTNTSNPSVMLGAGLLAKKAIERGLQVKSHVKTSLAPGSRVVSDYLDRAGLTDSLRKLGFHTVGYGCTTCIGNSGPLPEAVAQAVTEGNLVASAVLSGNRNFEGRVNPLVKANYLASPPLVVAYALAGTTDIDLATQPLGTDQQGQPVFLRDIWPSHAEIQEAVRSAVQPEMFRKRYGNVFDSNEQWNELPVEGGEIYGWNEASTYIQEPPFLIDLASEPGPVQPIIGARVLAALGDSVTTDHISPAGSIASDGPAGRYLKEHGVEQVDFNSFGSRRGNDRVMTRGTFANIRIRNQLAPGTEGGVTRHLPDGAEMSIYDAAMLYKQEGVPLVVLAGAEYGTGSSRDWAAKGTLLLGVRAVLASSYERIHRSNLVGMGVLPLEFPKGQTWQSLGLTGEEVFDIAGLDETLEPQSSVEVTATSPSGKVIRFEAQCRIDTPVELEYYRNGGILQTVLRKILKS